MKQLYLLILIVILSLFGQTTQKGIEGVWQGTLDAGNAKLRLVLTVTKSASGAYEAVLNSLDQGATLPVDEITVRDNAVRFEIKSVMGSFEGTLNADHSELSGNWMQGGVTLPLTFKASTQAPPAEARRPPSPPFTIPLDVTVPVEPTAFQSGGRTHLVYELHVTNMSPSECLLTRVEVTGDKTLASYEGVELSNMISRPGLPPTAEKPRIGAGLRAVVFLWETIEAGAVVPESLGHRLSVKVGDYPEVLSVTVPKVAIRKGVAAIGPPLRGGEWLAANGPSNVSGHRRALIPVDGRAHIAQRFAIDFVQLREDGRSFTGDRMENRNYRCYGAEALAVSDSVVTAVKDGIPENVPGPASRAVPITMETVGGNHVILDLGSGRYAFYAHLQPGSIRVKVGDRVRRGQVLGLVGNSGNSTEPHLHFHVSDGNSPLGSDGLPFAFNDFEVQGKGWGWKSSASTSAPEKRRLELPLQNEVVRFPAAK